MFKTNFDRSPLVITARLVLLLVVLGPLAFGIYSLRNLSLGDRHPALPTPPGARMEPRPTPHEPVFGEIPLIHGRVTSIAFYKSIPDQWQDSEYGTRFSREKDHYIYNIFYFEFPPADKVYEIQFDYIFYKGSEVFTTDSYTTKIEQGQTIQNVYYGWDYPPGLYYVEVLYEGKVVGNGAFEITE